MILFKHFIFISFLLLTNIFLTFSQNKKNEKNIDMKDYNNMNFPLLTPSKWIPGDEFIYTDSVLNITIKPDSIKNDIKNYSGQIFRFKNFSEKTDWLGNSSIFLIFEANENFYSFNTKKNLAQISDTTYNPLIPSFISLNELKKANDIFKGNELYILTNEWIPVKDKQPTFKFVNVRVDSISYGDSHNPYKVFFSYQGNQYYIFSNISNSLYGTSRNLFSNIFSFHEPKLKYKDIDEEIWEAIIASKIKRGMTQNEVRLSIGKPDNIQRIPTYSGLKEIWTYGNGNRINFFDARVTD